MTTVLVIDDDDNLRSVLRLILENLGCAVLEARNGKEGLILFRSAGADVVITDLIMPEKEGLETIRELRKGYPGLKIIAISGGEQQHARDNLKMAKFLGANAVLAKPFSADDLAKLIGSLLPPSSTAVQSPKQDQVD
jgi:CheY-like chemotaxis protein